MLNVVKTRRDEHVSFAEHVGEFGGFLHCEGLTAVD